MPLIPKDLALAQIHHQETDTIPYNIGFEGDVAERLDVYYGSDAWRNSIDNAIQSVPVPILAVDETAGPYYTDLYGSTWRVDRRPYHLVKPALKTPSLDGLTFPDLDALFGRDWKHETLRFIAQHSDYFLVAGFGFGLFERTWALRGFDEALMDAAGDLGFYDELVEAVTKHQLSIVARLLALPIDGVMFSDDWGYQHGILLGAERWRRVLKPGLARLYARVHQAGRVVLTHCCGSIADIMPDVIEIGLDVYQSVQPEARDSNPYELKYKYGDRITFWGGLGSQSIVPFGTPDDIRAEVTKLCREMGRDGGYILGLAKALQPETPTENAAAVVEAFLQQAGVS